MSYVTYTRTMDIMHINTFIRLLSTQNGWQKDESRMIGSQKDNSQIPING